MTTIIQPAGAALPSGSPLLSDLEVLSTSGLLGVWEFLEGTGSTVADLSTISGPITGLTGGAWGAGGFVFNQSAGALLPLSSLSAYTYVVVFKPDNTQTSTLGTLLSTNNGNTQGGHLSWSKTNDQLNQLRYLTSSNAQSFSSAGTTGLNWCCALASADGLGPGINIDSYNLASQTPNTTANAGTAVQGSQSIYLGRESTTDPGTSTLNLLKGTVGYVMIWNRSLSNAVVTAGIATERQKVLAWVRAKMALRSIAI